MVSIAMSKEYGSFNGIRRELDNGSIEVRYPESDTYYVYHPDGTHTVFYESGTIIKYKDLQILGLTSAAEGIEGVTFIPVCGGWVQKNPEEGSRKILDAVGNIVEVTA